jgi:hypothetical protein
MSEPNGFPMKVFLVYNMTAIREDDKFTLVYEKYPSGNDKTKWKAEYKVFIHKYQKLKLKVEERMPIHSRVDDHMWYLVKDKYGFLYVILADTTRFEEQFVFSLRGKIANIIKEDKDVFMKPSEDSRVRLLQSLFIRVMDSGC